MYFEYFEKELNILYSSSFYRDEKNFLLNLMTPLRDIDNSDDDIFLLFISFN